MIPGRELPQMKPSDSPFHYSVATRVRVPYIRRSFDTRKGVRVLDVGCGVGYFTYLLGQQGAHVFGLDADAGTLATAKMTTGQQYLLGTIEALPFADNRFDMILCSEVLEHVSDDRKAVSELCRVAQNGATILVTVPCTEGVFGSRIKSICHDHPSGNGDEEEAPNNWEHHQRDGYTRRELHSLLDSGGITVEEEWYSMVLFTELIMGATKLAYSATSGRKTLHGQGEVWKVRHSLPLRIYRWLFPLVLPITRLEDLVLSKLLKGHMLIVKGTISKPSQ